MRKISYVLLLFLAAAPLQAEPFDCMITTTRQDASLDWWYAVPEPFIPRINKANHVANGEYFRIIPFFKNYGVDSNQQAHITFDIQVVRPDGSIDESLTDCVGYNGATTASNLLASCAVLDMCFDPEDPDGIYSIQIVAYDHINSATNRQTTTVEQQPFKLQTLTAEQRDQLFFTYPTAPDPSRALASFLHTEHSFFNEETEPIWSAIWFFKTVFEENEFLLPHLLDAFPKGTPKQQRDTILLLALLGKADQLPRISGELNQFKRMVSSGRVPDPYDEITTGKQLDMLWAEFFATGRVKPIRQLVSALNLIEHAGTLDKIKDETLDPKNLEVYREGQLEAVFQSALWSLKSNCSQTPLIFQYCVGLLESDSLEKPVQRVLGQLLESVSP